MESRFRAGDDDWFPPPTDGYFSFQAAQAGIMDVGGMRQRPTLEALEMELREERIKEEILSRRIAQRRMLEEQARREMEISMAMGMGGGGGRMRRPVEPLMLGPLENLERRFGPRHGAGNKLALLEEVNDPIGEDVEFPRRRFGPPRLGLRDPTMKGLGPVDVEFGRRNVEFKERGRLGPRQEERDIEIENESGLWSKKPEFKMSSELLTSPAVTHNGAPTHHLQIIPQKLSGIKRKPVAAIAGGTGSSKFPRPAHKDWSCALCQVSATCEEGLDEHLQGKKHMAKVALLGSKNNFAVTTPAKNSRGIIGDPSASKPKVVAEKGTVSIKVDGKLYEVAEKGRYLWCSKCRVKCQNQSAMIAHLSGKRHSFESSKNPKAIGMDTSRCKDVGEDTKCKDVGEDTKERTVEAEAADVAGMEEAEAADVAGIKE